MHSSTVGSVSKSTVGLLGGVAAVGSNAGAAGLVGVRIAPPFRELYPKHEKTGSHMAPGLFCLAGLATPFALRLLLLRVRLGDVGQFDRHRRVMAEFHREARLTFRRTTQIAGVPEKVR